MRAGKPRPYDTKWNFEMPYDPFKHRRRSIRLRGYNYAQAGAYFVTIVIRDAALSLGNIVDGEMHLNEFGVIVQSCWDDLPAHYPNVELDAFVVMPNHVHGVIVLVDDFAGDAAVGAGLRPAPTTRPATELPRYYPLSEIVRAFKSFSARRINELRGTPGALVWQRNYFEHIVRNEKDLARIRKYIDDNPAHWVYDDENPAMRKSLVK